MDFFSLELPALPAAVIVIAAGALACFFGFRLFKIVLGLVGFAAGAIAAAGFAAFLAPDAKTLTLVATILAGAAGAFLLIWAYYVGVFVVGAVCGLVLGGMLGAWLSGTIEAIVVALLAIAGGVLALKLQRVMLGVSTAVIGAAAMVAAGLGLMTGADATESLVSRIASGGALGHAGWIAVLCWVLLTSIGIGVQLSSKKKGKKH